jgi:predicted transcriptional regulator
MEYDFDRVDEVVLALLALTQFSHHGQTRAWKTIDFAVMDRLHEKGFIEDPKNRNRSIALTDEG